ncbi:ABC transporter ATP-binding protein [Pseudaestuariivita rosea]|uniref:ABC transporter ATP-binding protein n=1 Tax=Pseudaestuariivita rosea TaxID=2763263 RepID=UPI001ABA6EC0|nr:ABC transporter ATP-binding protein [Pseudaestuariivita rosea]
MSISVKGLTKIFGHHRAVDDVSFDIPKGKLFCVVGPSGCGKSTLLRLIAGLETPQHGSIELDGQRVVGDDVFIPPEDRRVGVVFQSYALWPHLTVAENVAFPYQSQGFAKAEARAKAAEHLQTVALTQYAGRRPEALSGGQRQRVALARCLAGKAQTILMDEPLANLDPHLRETMETELRAFHDRSGVTTLFITHDQREAMALADIMAVMDQGHILQIGPPQQIYAEPANETVARFIGRGTLIKSTVQDGRARVADQDIAVTGVSDGPCILFVRPENIQTGPDGWPTQVTSVHYRGSHWEVTVNSAGLDADIQLNVQQPVQVGEQLRLIFEKAWVLPG